MTLGVNALGNRQTFFSSSSSQDVHIVLRCTACMHSFSRASRVHVARRPTAAAIALALPAAGPVLDRSA